MRIRRQGAKSGIYASDLDLAEWFREDGCRVQKDPVHKEEARTATQALMAGGGRLVVAPPPPPPGLSQG